MSYCFFLSPALGSGFPSWPASFFCVLRLSLGLHWSINDQLGNALYQFFILVIFLAVFFEFCCSYQEKTVVALNTLPQTCTLQLAASLQ